MRTRRVVFDGCKSNPLAMPLPHAPLVASGRVLNDDDRRLLRVVVSDGHDAQGPVAEADRVAPCQFGTALVSVGHRRGPPS
jgi:hypothetical protein